MDKTTKARMLASLPSSQTVSEDVMGEGSPAGTYHITPHPKHDDIEIVTLPNGREVYRVKGYPLPAYEFKGDGEGEIRPDGSRFYRVAGKGGICSRRRREHQPRAANSLRRPAGRP